MELGQMIAMRRKEAKMTIDELVAKSGIPKGTLNKIIAGTTRDPQLETVKAIARALNCTPVSYTHLDVYKRQVLRG